MHQQGEITKGVTIGKDVWIGVGCAILDGARIGDHAIIAPNAVVSGHVAEKTIASGNLCQAHLHAAIAVTGLARHA